MTQILSNIDLVGQDCFSNTQLKNQLNITKFGVNCHDLHSETSDQTNLRTPWDEKKC